MKPTHRILITICMALLLAIAIQLSASCNTGQKIKILGKVINFTNKADYNKVNLSYNTANNYIGITPQRIFADIDTAGNFSIELPDLGKPYSVAMSIFTSDKMKKLWEQKFFVESGDDVALTIDLNKQQSDEDVKAKGKGSDKYNLIKQIKRLRKLNFDTEYYEFLKIKYKPSKLTGGIAFEKALEDYSLLIKKYRTIQEDLLEKSNISEMMKYIIGVDFENYNLKWRFRMENFFDYPGNNNPEEVKLAVQKYYVNNVKQFPFKLSPYTIYCPTYTTWLGAATAIDLNLRAGKKTGPVELYDALKRNFSGPNLDRQLGNLPFSGQYFKFTTTLTSKVKDSIFRDAYRIVKTDYIKKAMEGSITELSRRINNPQLIDAQFIDRDGKQFDLKSMKGKVYFLEFWATGCSWCKQFYKTFSKEIYPKFRDNKNFAVLSVNVNNDRERWQQGIVDGGYTSNEYINVATLKGMEHPFTKYYGIRSTPYFMVIDQDGKFFWKNESVTTEEEIIQAISNALSILEKKSK